MIIVHSFTVPFFWVDGTGPYVIEDGNRRDLPSGTTRKDILWFKRPYSGGKNEALKIQMDWDVAGSGGRKYKVEVNDDEWSCDCHSFKFSGNKRTCKHIDEIRSSYLS
jgi:hypothetical protein